MSLSLQRFKVLIDAYGSQSYQWPEENRQDMQQLLDQSDEARNYLFQATSLDAYLDNLTVPDFSEAQQAFLSSYPSPSLLDQLIDWCLPPDFRQGWYKPLATAAIMLAIGMSLGAFTDVNLSQDYSESWEDEIYLLALQEEEQG